MGGETAREYRTGGRAREFVRFSACVGSRRPPTTASSRDDRGWDGARLAPGLAGYIPNRPAVALEFVQLGTEHAGQDGPRTARADPAVDRTPTRQLRMREVDLVPPASRSSG